MFFEVLDEVVFLAHFEIVPEVVDFLVRQQSLLIYLIESILLAPYHIPVLICSLLVTPILKRLIDTVGEISPVPDFGSIDMSLGCTFEIGFRALCTF